ncbi:hypothetical protein [Paracoccus alkanivorans]|uniref:Uncharacterized protein n=1 Tax=Paracoccus alkanivorans TaxID=2116655 RepID=A0A3M0MVJ9_9RHOB|nr:hypothetical protein [Paracoccus alkanivorans]RMC35347.1 hypothetical protein C9E81_08885 [Paracoccus alkanivorans]
MSRELIHKINDTSERLDEALMQGELLHDALVMLCREYPHLSYGADKITDIIRDVDSQLRAIADEVRTVPDETPVVKKYREYMSAYAIFESAAGSGQDDLPHYDTLRQIEIELHALPSLTAQDMAIKMEVGHSFGGHTCLDYDGEAWAEARALVADIALGDTAAKIKDAA